MSPLPVPKVDYQADPSTPEGLRAMFCNPVFTGIPPYERIIEADVWIQVALQEIKNDGLAQFLVNLLHVLRLSAENAER